MSKLTCEVEQEVNGQERGCKSKRNVSTWLGCKTNAWQQCIAKASHLLVGPEPKRDWVEMPSVYG